MLLTKNQPGRFLPFASPAVTDSRHLSALFTCYSFAVLAEPVIAQPIWSKLSSSIVSSLAPTVLLCLNFTSAEDSSISFFTHIICFLHQQCLGSWIQAQGLDGSIYCFCSVLHQIWCVYHSRNHVSQYNGILWHNAYQWARENRRKRAYNNYLFCQNNFMLHMCLVTKIQT